MENIYTGWLIKLLDRNYFFWDMSRHPKGSFWIPSEEADRIINERRWP